MNVLFLEDDTLFSETIADFLDDNGIDVELASDGEMALELSYEKHYDLYLFDINVPKIDGLKLLQLLRDANDTTPTIFLTSHTDKDVLTKGYDVGGDDYIKKPVDIDELLLKIRAFEKRILGAGKTHVALSSNSYYDTKIKQVMENGKVLHLPQKAITLLALLIEQQNKVVTKEMIIDRLWKHHNYSEGSLRVYISHIKKLLPKDALKNIKAVGYTLEI